MSSDAWEQRTLGYIADELACSAPDLTSMLTVFNRLTSGEAMPDRHRGSETGATVRRRSRTRLQRSSASGHRRRVRQRVWPFTAVALTVVTAIVMALVLTLTGHSAGGNSACKRGPLCAQGASKHRTW